MYIYINTYLTVPLPWYGRAIMSCIYFSIPVVGGWNVMQWAIGRAHESIGEKGEKLKIKKVEGIGNTSVVKGEKRIIK